MKNLVFLFSILILYSCSEIKYKNTIDMFDNLPEYKLSHKNKMPFILRAVTDFRIFDDYIVTRNWKVNYGVSVYNNNTGEEIKRLAYKGEGPDEYGFISSIEKYKDTSFIARTNNGKNYILFYNLNDVKMDGFSPPYHSINIYHGNKNKRNISTMTVLSDSIFVTNIYDENYMYGIYNINDDSVHYSIQYPNNLDDLSGLSGAYKSNIYQGALTSNRRNMVFFISYFADIIHFIKTENNNLYMVKNYEKEGAHIEKRNRGFAYSRTKTINFYLDVAYNDSLVYVLSDTGKNDVDTRKIQSEEYKRLCDQGYEKIYKKLLVFTEEGEPLYKIYLDINPLKIQFNKGKLYAMYYNAEGDCLINEYDLSKKTLM